MPRWSIIRPTDRVCKYSSDSPNCVIYTVSSRAARHQIDKSVHRLRFDRSIRGGRKGSPGSISLIVFFIFSNENLHVLAQSNREFPVSPIYGLTVVPCHPSMKLVSHKKPIQNTNHHRPTKSSARGKFNSGDLNGFHDRAAGTGPIAEDRTI
jgi:hypothetical protein